MSSIKQIKIWLILLSLMSVVFVSCNNKPLEETSSQPSEETSSQPSEETSSQLSEETSSQPSEETSSQPSEATSSQPSEATSSQPSEATSNLKSEQTENAQPIVSAGRLVSGYDMGVNTSGGRTDWVKMEDENSQCMAYPGNQSWGAVFITRGKPTPQPRSSQDLSQYQTLSLELRGAKGGESVLIGLKDNTDPDDGSETKIPVSNLTTDWKTFTIPLSKFDTADLSKLYVVTEFVFTANPQTVCFRNIEYLP